MARVCWWWEKTVEHLYVRCILSETAFTVPLDGDVETGVGDLITADDVGCTLIEFKKDKGTLHASRGLSTGDTTSSAFQGTRP